MNFHVERDQSQTTSTTRSSNCSPDAFHLQQKYVTGISGQTTRITMVEGSTRGKEMRTHSSHVSSGTSMISK